METHSFTLILSPPAFDFDLSSDLLYKAGCDDALFSYVDGSYELIFDREAPSLKEALDSAMRNVKEADIGTRIKAVYFHDEVK